jgi:hypothetical protein
MNKALASQRARIGGLVRASMYDGKEVTAKARKAFMKDYFLNQIPSDLPVEERLRRAGCLRKAHFTRLAYLSAKARAK